MGFVVGVDVEEDEAGVADELTTLELGELAGDEAEGTTEVVDIDAEFETTVTVSGVELAEPLDAEFEEALPEAGVELDEDRLAEPVVVTELLAATAPLQDCRMAESSL